MAWDNDSGPVANKVPLETLLLLAEANMTEERGQGDFVVQSSRKDVGTEKVG